MTHPYYAQQCLRPFFTVMLLTRACVEVVYAKRAGWLRALAAGVFTSFAEREKRMVIIGSRLLFSVSFVCELAFVVKFSCSPLNRFCSTVA